MDIQKFINYIMTNESLEKLKIFGIGNKISLYKEIKQQQDLETADNKLIDILVDGVYTPSQEKTVRIILRNQLNYINSDSSQLKKKDWMMIIAAKVMKQLMVFSPIIGIQPLTTNVGLMYSLTYKYKKENEVGSTYPLDGSAVRRLSLECVSDVVQVNQKAHLAKWKLENIQDLSSVNQLDIEREIISAISCELGTELSDEILTDLVTLANLNPDSQRITLTPNDPKVSFVSDPLTRIVTGINQNAAYIAKSTRRGVGNIVITSPAGIALLQSQTSYRFIPADHNDNNGYIHSGLQYVGYLTSESKSDYQMYKIYSTLSSALIGDNIQDVKFLVGYKGNNNELDAGYIYLPHTPIILPGIVVDPFTFCPLLNPHHKSTKWGKQYHLDIIEPQKNDNGGRLGTASDYYNLLTVNTSELFKTNTTEG